MATNDLDQLGILRQVFPELNDQAIHALNQAARLQAYPAGSVICREGDVGTTLFIMGRGEADIFVRADGDHEILVKTVRPHDYFGEMALFAKTPRAATIRATMPCLLIEIEQDTFIATADQNPALLRSMVTQISDHLRNNDRNIITELRRKNTALRVAYANLAEQERLRTEFIATLSHELRTPLTSAQGFLHLINKGIVKEETLATALESVTRSVEKMVELINSLLILYEMHLISPQFSEINLLEILSVALEDAEKAAGNSHSPATLEVAAGLPLIQGDRNGLILAIRSLIENALKFSPENTPIAVKAYSQDNGHIRCDVIDQGIGIPAEAQERIFEPFFRVEGTGASRLFPGLGVGLAIAKFIIERHGGRINVESSLGQGSTFSVFLPSPPANGV